jgi:exportin-5
VGPEALQASVLEWVLAGVRAEWARPEWQAHLATPEAFIKHYTPVLPDSDGSWQVGRHGRL